MLELELRAYGSVVAICLVLAGVSGQNVPGVPGQIFRCSGQEAWNTLDRGFMLVLIVIY